MNDISKFRRLRTCAKTQVAIEHAVGSTPSAIFRHSVGTTTEPFIPEKKIRFNESSQSAFNLDIVKEQQSYHGGSSPSPSPPPLAHSEHLTPFSRQPLPVERPRPPPLPAPPPPSRGVVVKKLPVSVTPGSYYYKPAPIAATTPSPAPPLPPPPTPSSDFSHQHEVAVDQGHFRPHTEVSHPEHSQPQLHAVAQDVSHVPSSYKASRNLM